MSLQGLVVLVLISSLLWLSLMPRGWFRSLDRAEVKIVRWFLAFRLVVPVVRRFIGSRSDQFFNSGWDVNEYDERGIRIAEQLASGFPVNAHREIPGTGSIDIAYGYFYSLAGPDLTAAFYLGTLLSTIGILLFWLATRHLVGLQRSWYAVMILFAPTIFYWSGGASKEPALLLGLGSTVMALSGLLSGKVNLQTGLYLLVGLFLMAVVRPHIALLFGAAALGGLLLGSVKHETRMRSGTSARKLIAIAAGVVLIVVAVPLTSELLGVNTGDNVFDAAYARRERTASGYGGSAYEAQVVRTPAQVPAAVASVLFRPLIWETRTPFQILASFESLIFLSLLSVRLVWLLQGRARLVRSPLVITAVLFVLLFSSAFVATGNFGLLVRQRMQVWPFLILVTFAIVLKLEPASQSSGCKFRTSDMSWTGRPPGAAQTSYLKDGWVGR